MGVLNDIAAESLSVEVMGETIRLRYPDYQTQVRIRKRIEGADLKTDKASEIQSLMGDIFVQSLVATVVDQDMEASDWSRLITVSNAEPDKYPGLIDLCNLAVKLCGLDLTIQKDENPENGSADPVSEVDDAIGVDPTL